jgi:EmrB/QacA subfamily drug resistance transporter
MTSAADHAPVVTQRRETLILWLACVAQFMVILDVSVVNVALPSIGRALNFTPTGLQWVVNAYVLAFAGFLLLGGRAADLFGRRRIFLLGAILFAAASLAGGLATTSGMLTAARVAQGFGGAFLSPATLTIIVTTFHGPRLPKALGAWGAVGGAGGAIGSLAGGILTAELSWRWVLFINVPIGIAVIVGALLWLPELSRKSSTAKLDVPGAILVTAGLSVLVYAIVGTDTHPWGSATTLSWMGAAIALLAAFCVVEIKFATAPLIPFSFLIKRTTASSNFVMLLIGAAFFSMWYFLTLYIQEVLGFSALKTGFAFAPMAIAIIIGAQIASRSMVKIGVWRLILVGTSIACVGFFWMSHLSATGTYFGNVFGAALTISFSLGLLFSPLAAAATSQAGPTEAGLASGLLNTSRQIGGAVGLAVLATVAVDATTRALGGTHPGFGLNASLATKEALTHGYNVAFLIGSMICLVAVLATFLIPRSTGKAMMSSARKTVYKESIEASE